MVIYLHWFHLLSLQHLLLVIIFILKFIIAVVLMDIGIQVIHKLLLGDGMVK